MKLILTDDDGTVIDSWDAYTDHDIFSEMLDMYSLTNYTKNFIADWLDSNELELSS